MTKNLYAIHDYRGIFLCHQVATSEAEAVDFAKMYEFRAARKAVFVREN